MKKARIKTPDEVKQEFLTRGESIAAWCKDHHVSTAAAYRVLREPRVRATRGECHRAAVLLGLKVGEVKQERQSRTPGGASAFTASPYTPFPNSGGAASE